ncbi:MAG: Bax inhibitor-1/YccA family protein [Defluviitaleaceae bacterium]|nr:Bax inhibitor-1/YccA family protein [Defluviitaleaceae bacterium]
MNTHGKRHVLDDALDNFRPDTGNMHQQHTITQDDVNHFMRGVFWWMLVGLMLTATVSFGYVIVLQNNLALQQAHSMVTIVSWLAAFGIVITLSAAINRLSSGSALTLYIVYSMLMGLAISSVLIIYAIDTVFIAFGMAALFFAIMAIFGYTTQSDLTSMGRIFTAGLIALIIAMVANWFIGSDQMTFFISIAGIAIFCGLTAYDVQRLKSYYYHHATEDGVEATAKLSVVGALLLYLSLINLFLFILRLVGRKN